MFCPRPEVRLSSLSISDPTVVHALFTPSFSANLSLAFFQADGAWVGEITMIARQKCKTRAVQPAPAAGVSGRLSVGDVMGRLSPKS